MTEETENIPQANELLFTLKLTTGEELLCTVISEEQYFVKIESPIQIKMIPMLGEDGELRNEISSSMWMPFAKDRIFRIPYSSIMIFTSMHETAQKLYTKMVNRFESQLSTEPKEEKAPSDKTFFVNTSEAIQ